MGGLSLSAVFCLCLSCRATMDDSPASRLWQAQPHVVGGCWLDRYGQWGLFRTLNLNRGLVCLARRCLRANRLRGNRDRCQNFRFRWTTGGSSSSFHFSWSWTGILSIAPFSSELLHLLPEALALNLLSTQPCTQLLTLCVKLGQLLFHFSLHLLALLALIVQLLLQFARGATLLIQASLELIEAL